MSDLDATTPRVFLARHGETEWTKTGQFTGISDIPLTTRGEAQVESTGKALVGTGKLLDPARVKQFFVSPRQRALKTFDLLFKDERSALESQGKVTVTEDIAEWNYGKYEGLLTAEIRSSRKRNGLDSDREWKIWRDGCEGGESAKAVVERLDRLIKTIKDIQRPHIRGDGGPADVVLIAHGVILRAFAKRWLGHALDADLTLMLSPGAIGILSYAHHNMEEPAIFIGLSLP